jgi:hypothetical protein
MNNSWGRWLAWLMLAMAASGSPAWAQDQTQDQAQQLRTLRDTTIALLNELVQQGVLTRAKADELIRKAEEAGQGASRATATPPAAASPPAGAAPPAAAGAGGAAPGAAPSTAAGAATGAVAAPPGVISVPYIPESVKEEIRDEIKQDVVSQAKTERWGVPGTLPDWLSRITWYGDVRLRYQAERFPTDSAPNATPQELALPQNGAYTLSNTSEPVNILRIRARFGMDATISDSVSAGIRLATGGVGIGTNGASESQTLGNYSSRESVGLDLAYLAYHPASWFSMTGGRLGDPFFHSTTLVWSNDLSLEGVVASLTPKLTRDFSLFATAGLFPIQDIEPSPTSDAPSKWLYGYQTGLNWLLPRDSALHFAVALYDYRGVEGVLNPSPFVTLYSATAAPFRQDGNSVFDINELANTLNGTQNYLIGLVSKFHELNGSATLDLGFGGRTHVIVDLDYVKNLGFNAADIFERTGLTLAERTTGAQADLKVGDPNFARTYNWQGFIAYRYAQRDSVIDAFTDADFNLGGTNAQGYILGGEFAFAPNTTLRARWFSSKQIDGLPLAMNILMIDATTAF